MLLREGLKLFKRTMNRYLFIDKDAGSAPSIGASARTLLGMFPHHLLHHVRDPLGVLDRSVRKSWSWHLNRGTA